MPLRRIQLYHREKILTEIWTDNVGLASLEGKSSCVSSSIPFLDLAIILQRYSLDLNVALKAVAHFRHLVPEDEEREIERLEHERQATVKALKDLRPVLSQEEKQTLNQELQIHKSTPPRVEHILGLFI